MAKVRVKEPVSIYDHDAQVFVTPAVGDYWDDSDPFVKANRWAFATDEELAEIAAAPALTEVTVEAATAAPGERRATKRATPKK